MLPTTSPSLSPMQLALRRVDQLTGLLELGRALNAGRSRADLVAMLLGECARGVAAARAALFVVGPGGALASQGNGVSLTARPGQGLIGAAAGQPGSLLVNALASEPRFDATVDALGLPEAGALLAVPVRDLSGNLVGVLAAVHESEGHFDRDAAELLEALAGLAAAMLR
jgi:GAF domain-containing protein